MASRGGVRGPCGIGCQREVSNHSKPRTGSRTVRRAFSFSIGCWLQRINPRCGRSRRRGWSRATEGTSFSCGHICQRRILGQFACHPERSARDDVKRYHGHRSRWTFSPMDVPASRSGEYWRQFLAKLGQLRPNESKTLHCLDAGATSVRGRFPHTGGDLRVNSHEQ